MHVDLVLAGERRGVGVGIIDRPTDRDACVVDEDVEPAKIPGDVVHQPVDVGGGGLVRLVGAGVDAPGFQFANHGFGLVGGSDVADGDVGAFIRERLGAGRADTA